MVVWREEIRGHERQRCGIFLFHKDIISSLRVQGCVSEAVSCCTLCCLFDAPQLIIPAVEIIVSLHLSTVNTTNCLCSTVSWHPCGGLGCCLAYQFCPTHISLCANVLCAPWSCAVIWLTAKVVPALAHAPEHCACPLDCLQLQWWNQTHLSAALILNCTNFIILLPGTTPWKSTNNNSKIQFDKAIIGFTNIWGEMWSQIIYLMKSCDIGHM